MRNFDYYINYTYSGGMNNTDEPDNLTEMESVLIQNAYIRERGKIEKRSGITLLGNDTGSTKITGLASWQENDGTKWQLRTTGTNLQYLNTTSDTWDNLDTGFTTGLDTEFLKAKNKIYILNGTDTIHSWDGASVTTNSCLTDLGSGIPTGKYAVFWKNYMFVTGEAKLGSTIYGTRVYFSNLADPDTFTTNTDYFDVNLNDGQKITALGVIDKYLIIGKEKSIYIMSGDSPADWKISSTVNNISMIENSVGIASHRSMVQVGNDVWFMGTDYRVRSLVRNVEGTTPFSGIVSGKIEGTMGNINKTQVSKVASTLFNGRVYVSFANATSNYNNKVAVADTSILLEDPRNPHPWVEYTGWHPSCWDVYAPSTTPQLYYGEADADSKCYQAETGTDDNSVAIDFDYKSPIIDQKMPDQRKTFRFIIVSGQSGGDYDISIYTSVDGTTYDLKGTLNLSSGDVWNTGVWGTATWGFGTEKKQKFALQQAATQLQIRFRNNAASQPIAMYPYTLAIKKKKVE
jgi:hypothetical protein